MSSISDSIVYIARKKGLFSMDLLKRSDQLKTFPHIEISDAVEVLVNQGRLCKFLSGKEFFLCAPMGGRWDHEDVRYSMDANVAADVQRSLSQSSDMKKGMFKEAFDELFASMNQEERPKKKMRSSKALTNSHLSSLFD